MSKLQASLWGGSNAYEKYMGRWSRRIAPGFLDWLQMPLDAEWIDVGCGTGVLSSTIVAKCAPKRVVGIDPSEAFIELARSQIDDRRFQCQQGNAEAIPYEDNEFNVAASGLVLNFVSNKNRAVAEMILLSNRVVSLHCMCGITPDTCKSCGIFSMPRPR
jgi:ubiquinone/menaquinone biosynthesis C-methylase UbiE